MGKDKAKGKAPSKEAAAPAPAAAGSKSSVKLAAQRAPAQRKVEERQEVDSDEEVTSGNEEGAKDDADDDFPEPEGPLVEDNEDDYEEEDKVRPSAQQARATWRDGRVNRRGSSAGGHSPLAAR